MADPILFGKNPCFVTEDKPPEQCAKSHEEVRERWYSGHSFKIYNDAHRVTIGQSVRMMMAGWDVVRIVWARDDGSPTATDIKLSMVSAPGRA